MLSWEILLMVKTDKKEEKRSFLKRKIIDKVLLKKQPQATVVFKQEEPHSKYFKREWERAKWI